MQFSKQNVWVQQDRAGRGEENFSFSNVKKKEENSSFPNVKKKEENSSFSNVKKKYFLRSLCILEC